ncbi:MAG: hypothetical protein KGR26_09480, partial [Cyanobacteria bacterium REEB65]|nr:hypothetical protein [Cyanobacteria bacterium REEB65]
MAGFRRLIGSALFVVLPALLQVGCQPIGPLAAVAQGPLAAQMTVGVQVELEAPAGRSVQFNGGSGALYDDVSDLLVGLFDAGATTVPSLGYRYSGPAGSITSQALSSSNDTLIVESSVGVGAMLGTPGTGAASSGKSPSLSARANLRRYLLRDLPGSTGLVSNAATVSFSNVPVADGTEHTYIVFTAAFDSGHNLLGYSEAALPDSDTQATASLVAASLTLKLSQGIVGSGATVSAALSPFPLQVGASDFVLRNAGTVAGDGTAGFAGDGGSALAGELADPTSVVASGGVLYFADTANNRVRRVQSGTLSTIAGNGTGGFSGDGGAASSAELNQPGGVAIDDAGRVYVSDSANARIRTIVAGTIATLAGNGTTGYAGDDGLASLAEFDDPQGLAVDASGDVYIADTGNNCVRMLAQTQLGTIVTTIAGTASAGFAGDGGAATKALLSGPVGLTLDASGDLFIADTGNDRIREISAGGTITTVAGDGSAASSGDGGPASSAGLAAPIGIAVDPAGNLYIAESGSCKVREVDSAGIIETVAGTGASGDSGDGGLGLLATFGKLSGLVIDPSTDYLYLADAKYSVIRLL